MTKKEKLLLLVLAVVGTVGLAIATPQAKPPVVALGDEAPCPPPGVCPPLV